MYSSCEFDVGVQTLSSPQKKDTEEMFNAMYHGVRFNSDTFSITFFFLLQPPLAAIAQLLNVIRIRILYLLHKSNRNATKTELLHNRILHHLL